MHTYGFERNLRSYLYTKCIQCGSFVKMKFLKMNNTHNLDEKYRLIFFDNTHNHVNFAKKRKHQYNMTEVFEVMQNTPKNMPIDEFKHYLKSKYDISDSHIYYMLSRFRKYHESIYTITEYLKKHKALIWTEIFKIDQPLNTQDAVQICAEEDPHFFMFVLPRMEQNFQRYGDCCYFSITKGLIKKKNVLDCRQWHIIAFNGLSFHNKFAPFALAFLEVTPKIFENILQLIERVFNWAKKVPKTFITPSKPIYQKIVNSLRKKGVFQGLHIYDALQELENIQKVISDNNQFRFFQDIVQSTCRSEYQSNIQKFFKNVVPTLEVRKMFNNLQKKASKMCYALIDTDNFIGMGYKYSANRYMSILVRYLYTHNSQTAKISLPRPKELYPSIKFLAKEYLKLLQPELPYIRYDTWKFQNIMNIPQMILVRNRIKQAVMDIFLSQFNKAFSIDAKQRPITNLDNPEMRIYDTFDKYSKAIYVVAPRPQYTSDLVFKKIIWRCNCLYSLKCGMPCAHEIKVLMLNHGSLLDQIHDRWIEPKIGRKKAPGRPKGSRRNMMK